MDPRIQENSGLTDVATTYFKVNIVRISAMKECRGGGGVVQPFLTGGLAASCRPHSSAGLSAGKPTASTE
jgi:hypothetical protein